MASLTKLNNNILMPSVAFGTWKMSIESAKQGVTEAISVGYRHIDTACRYDNEVGVGQAINGLINENKIKREDIFLTTKIGNTFHGRERAVKGIKQSLNYMGLKYLDLALIHWPTGFRPVSETGHEFVKTSDGKGVPSDEGIVQTWKGMEDAVRQGLTKSIGVSNFNVNQLSRILSAAEIKPVCIQVEVHPLFDNHELINYCNENDIKVCAYSPLGQGKGELLNDNSLKQIAEKHNKTVGQVILRWNIQRGVVVITNTSKKNRLSENLDLFDFQISDTDMETISKLNTNKRVNDIPGIQDHPEYPFVPY